MGGPPQPFAIDVAEQGDATVVHVVGELDLAVAPELEGTLLPLLEAGKHVVLDLRELDFLDSSGVRALVHAHNQAEDGPGRFSVVCVPGGDGSVWRVLEVSGVDQALDVLDAPPAG
ncbi:STAS domain-containing protein [Conexibacter sp. SYSU D00693]|uniref:STAS domain-containing protein n=1 Tax=Conexibacter sp. SYSU D00693 TaxID=2812560 RepID=UPI00196B4943|nr:STAS domain-containing protein [Conexibacter sp. SYSU D00693]